MRPETAKAPAIRPTVTAEPAAIACKPRLSQARKNYGQAPEPLGAKLPRVSPSSVAEKAATGTTARISLVCRP